LDALAPRSVRGRDLVAFTQELATLVEAGLPLDRALAILGELTPSARLGAVAGALLAAGRGGTSLGDALAQHSPRPFSRLYVNMVRAGEKGGVLDATLKRLAEYLEESQALRDTVASALIYPALLATVGPGAGVFLLAFVIPRFADIFKDLGGAIPLPTQILLEVSGGLQRFWWVLAILALGAAVGAPPPRLGRPPGPRGARRAARGGPTRPAPAAGRRGRAQGRDCPLRAHSRHAAPQRGPLHRPPHGGKGDAPQPAARTRRRRPRRRRPPRRRAPSADGR